MIFDGNSKPAFSPGDMYRLRLRASGNKYAKVVFDFVSDTFYMSATKLSMSQLGWLWKIKKSLSKQNSKNLSQGNLPF